MFKAIKKIVISVATVTLLVACKGSPKQVGYINPTISWAIDLIVEEGARRGVAIDTTELIVDFGNVDFMDAEQNLATCSADGKTITIAPDTDDVYSSLIIAHALGHCMGLPHLEPAEECDVNEDSCIRRIRAIMVDNATDDFPSKIPVEGYQDEMIYDDFYAAAKVHYSNMSAAAKSLSIFKVQ